MIYKTYQFRVYTKDHEKFNRVLEMNRILYNAALEHKREAYRRGKQVSYFDQNTEFVGVRKDDSEWAGQSTWIGRMTLKRLDNAYGKFFRSNKNDGKVGLPRFKSENRWHTIELLPQYYTVKNNRIKVKGLPTLRFRQRDLPPSKDCKKISITRRGKKLYATLVYAVETTFLPENIEAVGIDMGISDRMVLSNGSKIERREQSPDIKKKHKRLSACKKGSNEWRKRKEILSNVCHKERVKNRNALHRITSQIVKNYGFIAVEGLNIKGMSSGKKKRGLNREIRSQSWGIIKDQLIYKAENAGRKLVLVNPQYTSQTCSNCGVIEASNRNKKEYNCFDCGYSGDADINAAKNILNKALAGGKEPAAVLEAA